MIKIPCVSKRVDVQPLCRAVKHAAHNMGVSEFFAATLMTYFLERLAEEVAQGNVVRIPGFGMFAVYGFTIKKWKKYLGRRYCLPTFSASAGFRQQVAMLPFDRNHNDLIFGHRRSNSVSRKVHTNRRVFTAMAGVRHSFYLQAEKLGMEDNLPPPRTRS